MSRELDISDEVREKGRLVLDRLDADGVYRDRYAADPRTVLEEAGIPEEVMPVLAAAAEPEVEGFVRKAGTATCDFGLQAMGHVAGGCTDGCGTTTNCVTDGENCVRSYWYSA